MDGRGDPAGLVAIWLGLGSRMRLLPKASARDTSPLGLSLPSPS
jgi:hypothetical protein